MLRSPAHLSLISRIKEARLGRCMTQDQLASALGRPQSFVAKIEVGERKLSVLELLEICIALEIDFATILGPVNEVLRCSQGSKGI